MSRGGTRMQGPSLRRCIATGETQPKAGMIRFAADPDGCVVPDILEKLPGRGVWVVADRAALERAVSRRLFARGFKAAVTVSEDLAADVEARLARRAVELISLARKSGEAVTGYEKVRDWLSDGRARVLIQAADGSERGKKQLRPPHGAQQYIGILASGELGMAFGREKVIHAAVASGGLCKRIVEEAERLSGVREKTVGRPAGKVQRPHERR